jgi:hypothetical protein
MPKKSCIEFCTQRGSHKKISHNGKKENLAHKELTYYVFGHKKHPHKMIMLS